MPSTYHGSSSDRTSPSPSPPGHTPHSIQTPTQAAGDAHTPRISLTGPTPCRTSGDAEKRRRERRQAYRRRRSAHTSRPRPEPQALRPANHENVVKRSISPVTAYPYKYTSTQLKPVRTSHSAPRSVRSPNTHHSQPQTRPEPIEHNQIIRYTYVICQLKCKTIQPCTLVCYHAIRVNPTIWTSKYDGIVTF